MAEYVKNGLSSNAIKMWLPEPNFGEQFDDKELHAIFRFMHKFLPAWEKWCCDMCVTAVDEPLSYYDRLSFQRDMVNAVGGPGYVQQQKDVDCVKNGGYPVTIWTLEKKSLTVYVKSNMTLREVENQVMERDPQFASTLHALAQGKDGPPLLDSTKKIRDYKITTGHCLHVVARPACAF
jgi:hypothetical protein